MAQFEGDWQSARILFCQASELRSDHAALLCRMALMEYESGNFVIAETYMKKFLDTAVGISRRIIAYSIPAAARITGSLKHFEMAEAIANEYIKTERNTDRMRRVLGLIAVRRGDKKQAGDIYKKLTSDEEEHRILDKVEPFNGITAFRVLGLLAALIGELDKAVRHFEEGYELCKTGGCRPELAWTCCDWADALLQRNSSGDKQKAKELLEEGLEIAEKIGMRPLKERIIERLEKLAGTKPVYPDGLTQREVEVLRLITSGKTNQEIADTLHISEKTVANHISNIFVKTNSGNRTEAAAYANRNGLAVE